MSIGLFSLVMETSEERKLRIKKRMYTFENWPSVTYAVAEEFDRYINENVVLCK